MDLDYGHFVITLLGLSIIFTGGESAECRGSEVDSSSRSWIELNRPLPADQLNYIAVRFCRADPILLQIWEPQDGNNYKLLWQRELQPDHTYLGQVQVFPVPDPFTLRETYRYGIAGSGTFPVETIFDSNRRTTRTSIYSAEEGIFSAGEIKEFSELSRPVYFHVWFCSTRECPSEEELIHTYENELEIRDKEVVVTQVPPDLCRTESLHPAGGRVMLEEHTTYLPHVARALRLYLCDDTMFTAQLWEPIDGREYKQVWSKVIIPDPGSGGGYRRTIPLEEEEVVYLQPYYRLALHVPDEHKRIPVPSIFSYSENVVFSERKKEKFHRCGSQLFEEVAFPYNFRIEFCSTRDCSESNETWSADDPTSLDVLPSVECPEEVIPDLTETTTQVKDTDDTRDSDAVTTGDKDAQPEGAGGAMDDRDINRTNKDGDKSLENELEVPNTKKSSSSAYRVAAHISLILGAVGGCWLALL